MCNLACLSHDVSIQLFYFLFLSFVFVLMSPLLLLAVVISLFVLFLTYSSIPISICIYAMVTAGKSSSFFFS